MDRRWRVWLVVGAVACAGGQPALDPTSGGTDALQSTNDTSTGAATGHTAARATTGLTGMTGLWSLTGCTGTPVPDPNALADVEGVSMQGGGGDWTVSVTVRAPDVDCDQYADWWEILTPEGALVYRRILNHSHADEQPFTRSSEGTVPLDSDTTYRVRAHLHPNGFGGQVMEGVPGGTFSVVDVDEGWADDLGTAEPLPEECWF